MRALRRFLRQPFGLLLMLPTAIALGIGATVFPLAWIEGAWPGLADILPSFDPDTAHLLLSVLAGSAMTALSLAYSMTLVVFTLAASAIGPRLMKRFTNDPVGQVTAGALAGSFLYGLLAIAFVTPDARPSLTVLFGIALAAHAVLQLIFFVRHVARSVSIDDEVAAIGKRLSDALKTRRDRYVALDGLPEDDAFAHRIMCGRSGYIGAIDEPALVALAADLDVVIKLEEAPGSYILEGAPLARLDKEIDEEAKQKIAGMINLDQSRSDGREVEFSIHLLVEIGLRALSPGINDQYTAIAVSDVISGALAEIMKVGDTPSGIAGADGAPRLVAPGLSPKQLIGQAYHPLRRTGGTSVLMCQGLARAYSRLYVAAAAPDDRQMIAEHVTALLETVDAGDHLPRDRESVIEFLPEVLRERVRPAT